MTKKTKSFILYYLVKRLLIVSVLFSSCAPSSSIEDKAKKYVTDSVLSNFNDPKSFEFVSVNADTVSSHDLSNIKLQEFETDLNRQQRKKKEILENIESDKKLGLGQTMIDADLRIDSLTTAIISSLEKDINSHKAILNKPDLLHHIEINIKYRAKNAMGALMLDNMLLFYYPEINRFEVSSLQDKK